MSGVTTACEYLADQGILVKASTPVRLTKRSNVQVQEIAFFFAAINVLPGLALISMRDVDPFLRRLFWLVVPLWFVIHVWAARLGEGIMYLAPTTLIIVPLVLQALERRLVVSDQQPERPSALQA